MTKSSQVGCFLIHTVSLSHKQGHHWGPELSLSLCPSQGCLGVTHLWFNISRSWKQLEGTVSWESFLHTYGFKIHTIQWSWLPIWQYDYHVQYQAADQMVLISITRPFRLCTEPYSIFERWELSQQFNRLDTCIMEILKISSSFLWKLQAT